MPLASARVRCMRALVGQERTSATERKHTRTHSHCCVGGLALEAGEVDLRQAKEFALQTLAPCDDDVVVGLCDGVAQACLADRQGD